MKFLKLFLFFRFGYRKAFKSDVTGERILISKAVQVEMGQRDNPLGSTNGEE